MSLTLLIDIILTATRAVWIKTLIQFQLIGPTDLFTMLLSTLLYWISDVDKVSQILGFGFN